MTIEVFNQPWSRKHDDPSIPIVPAAARTVFAGGQDALKDLITLCTKGSGQTRWRASGSHWGLSRAAVSDEVFIETHDPADQFPAMDRTLFEVVPGCLNDAFVQHLANQQVPAFDEKQSGINQGMLPVCIETGKRIYQLYAELDDEDPPHASSLAALLDTKFQNKSYHGPWAFPTLGGAGGQTVFGALHTGTHGGDINLPPVGGAVAAMHLVCDGGKHYWIEPESLKTTEGFKLTDDTKLKALYGDAKYGGPSNFTIIRDDDMFNAVLMGAGRFGVVYSVVLLAVRQYCLRQVRTLTDWQSIRGLINDPNSILYQTPVLNGDKPKFLQIAVSLTSYDNFRKNLAGITRRWNAPAFYRPGTTTPAGRDERVGKRIQDIGADGSAAIYSQAGKSHGYEPDPQNPGTAKPANFLQMACSEGHFTIAILKQLEQSVKDFVATNGAAIAATLAAVAGTTAVLAASGIGGIVLGLLSLLAALAIAVLVIAAAIAAIAALVAPRFAQALDIIRALLLNSPDPAVRAAGLFIWQCLIYEVFKSQQGPHDYTAISYAVMDGHDYLDISCNVNVESVEVFFNAMDPMLPAYVDALIHRQKVMEVVFGQSTAGYMSLRFTGKSGALIGPQQFDLNCAVEVAALADLQGGRQMVEYATLLALDSNMRGILHWGQKNESTLANIEERFGDGPLNPNGPLAVWRSKLSSLTDNGRLAGFSSAFSRQTGLEITKPTIQALSVNVTPGAPASVVLSWDCSNNPPGTFVTAEWASAGSMMQHVLNPAGLSGSLVFVVSSVGQHTLTFSASTILGNRRRNTEQTVTFTV